MEEAAPKVEMQELREKFDALKQDLADGTRMLKDRVVTGTKEWATGHPATSLGVLAGVSAGIGLLIGLYLGRRV